MSNRIKGILFDLDGTLVDSMPVYAQSLALLLWEKCKIRASQAELRQVIAGRPTHEALRHYAPERLNELARDWLEYAKPFHHTVALFPGVRESLDFIRDHGVKMGVVTSVSRGELLGIRPWIKIDEYINRWVCLEDVLYPKPAPDPVQLGARDLGLDIFNVVMVGDSPYDLQAGQSAGALNAAALWGYGDAHAMLELQPDYILKYPVDLCDLVG